MGKEGQPQRGEKGKGFPLSGKKRSDSTVEIQNFDSCMQRPCRQRAFTYNECSSNVVLIFGIVVVVERRRVCRKLLLSDHQLFVMLMFLAAFERTVAVIADCRVLNSKSNANSFGSSDNHDKKKHWI